MAILEWMGDVNDRNEPGSSQEEDLYEVHPLDRDYSSSTPPARGVAIEYDEKFRRIGVVIFAAGFITVFLMAVFLGNVRGNDRLESIAGGIHRLGMILILVGGLVIIVAYRLPQLRGQTMPKGLVRWDAAVSFHGLISWNVIAFLFLVPASYLVQQIQSPAVYFMVFSGTISIFSAFLATVAVWHRGHLRGYALGVLVPLVLLGNQPFMYGSVGWGRGAGTNHLLTVSLAIMLLSGLLCAGYVAWLEAGRARQTK